MKLHHGTDRLECDKKKILREWIYYLTIFSRFAFDCVTVGEVEVENVSQCETNFLIDIG